LSLARATSGAASRSSSRRKGRPPPPFDGCGTLLSAQVASDSSGNSKGCGFVQFDTDEPAKKAIDTVNGEKAGRTRRARNA